MLPPAAEDVSAERRVEPVAEVDVVEQVLAALVPLVVVAVAALGPPVAVLLGVLVLVLVRILVLDKSTGT